MPNQRKKGKKKLQVWLNDDVRASLTKIANSYGYETVTAFLEAVGTGEIKMKIGADDKVEKDFQEGAKKWGLTRDEYAQDLTARALRLVLNESPKKKRVAKERKK